MDNFQLLLTYKEVFPEKDDVDTENKLDGTSKELILKVCAHFLRMIALNKAGDLQWFFQHYFSSKNAEYANNVYNRVIKLQAKTKADYRIVNPINVMTLMESVINLKDDEMRQLKPIELSEIDVFELFLSNNQKVTEEQEGAGEKIRKEFGKEAVFHMLLFSIIPYNDYTNYDRSDVIRSELVRSILFFSYSSEHDSLKPHLTELYERLNISHWNEFIKALFGLIFDVVRSIKDGYVQIVIDESSIEYQILNEYLSLESSIEEDVDFLPLRNKPVVKLHDGNLLVLSEIFLFEKLHRGLYFFFDAINKTLPGGDKLKDFRSTMITKGYSEEYVLYSCIEKMFSFNKYGKMLPGKYFEEKGIDGIIDYYVRDKKTIYLFESKDILFNKDVKTSNDYDLILKELKKKLFGKPGEKAAVLQLIHNIEIILKREVSFDELDKIQNLTICPIIIVHDRFFELSVLERLVNQWYSEELAKREIIPQGTRDVVHDIVVLPASTMVLVQDAIGNKKLNLLDEIKAYQKHKKERTYFSQEKYLHDQIQRTTVSFSDYLKNKAKAKGVWHSSYLDEFIKTELF